MQQCVDVSNRPRERRRQEAGLTLIEVVITAMLLIMASLTLAYAVTSTSVSSKASDRMLRSQQSLDEARETIDQLPFHELPSWNGVRADFGDHSVLASIEMVESGLALVELTVIDDTTDTTLARIATYRSGDR